MAQPGTSFIPGPGVGGSSIPGHGDGIGTNDSWPIWTGKVDNPGDTVTFEIDGQTYEVTPDANGVWDFTPPDPLPNGDHEISVTAKNAAGEETTIAEDWGYNVDADRNARRADRRRHDQWEEGGRDAFHDANAGGTSTTTGGARSGAAGGGGDSELGQIGGGTSTTSSGGGGGGGSQPPSEKGNQPRA